MVFPNPSVLAIYCQNSFAVQCPINLCTSVTICAWFSSNILQLAILYTHGTSQPEACWVMLGIGIRFVQDVGAHRKRFKEKQPVESELWKRCFWVLVCFDAIACSFLGRPRATVSAEWARNLACASTAVPTHFCHDQFRLRLACRLWWWVLGNIIFHADLPAAARQALKSLSLYRIHQIDGDFGVCSADLGGFWTSLAV